MRFKVFSEPLKSCYDKKQGQRNLILSIPFHYFRESLNCLPGWSDSQSRRLVLVACFTALYVMLLQFIDYFPLSTISSPTTSKKNFSLKNKTVFRP